MRLHVLTMCGAAKEMNGTEMPKPKVGNFDENSVLR